MSLFDTLVELQEGPDRQRAARELLVVLRSFGVRRGELAAFHADATQHVLVKLLEGTRPTGTSDAAVRSYLATMVNHRQIDLSRKAKRFAPEQEAVVEPPAPEPESPQRSVEELDARSRALLQRAFAHAVARRTPANRPALEQSWRELQAILSGRTIAALLEAEHGLAPGSAEWARGAARMYTAHKRAREALVEATEALIAAGEISSEDAAVARANLRRLWSRQQAEGPASTGEQT